MSAHPIISELLKSFAEAPAVARKAVEDTRRGLMLRALEEIYSHAHCARVQRAPSDDAIIAEHSETIERLAKQALDDGRSS